MAWVGSVKYPEINMLQYCLYPSVATAKADGGVGLLEPPSADGGVGLLEPPPQATNSALNTKDATWKSFFVPFELIFMGFASVFLGFDKFNHNKHRFRVMVFSLYATNYFFIRFTSLLENHINRLGRSLNPALQPDHPRK